MIFVHEYAMAFYGVLLWQIEQICADVLDKTTPNFTFKQRIATIIRSMGWVALLIVFDDELLAQYNKIFEIDIHELPLYGYTIGGFFVDVALSKIKKYKKLAEII